MKKNRWIGTIFLYGFMIFLTFIFLFPLIWMLVSSMKNEQQIFSDLGTTLAFLPPAYESIGAYFSNYAEAMQRVDLIGYTINSLIYSVGVVIFALVVNSMAGCTQSVLFFDRQARPEYYQYIL